MAISEYKNGHFEGIREWLQILEWGSNSTIFYLTFSTHDSLGAVFIWKWEIYRPHLLVCQPVFVRGYLVCIRPSMYTSDTIFYGLKITWPTTNTYLCMLLCPSLFVDMWEMVSYFFIHILFFMKYRVSIVRSIVRSFIHSTSSTFSLHLGSYNEDMNKFTNCAKTGD